MSYIYTENFLATPSRPTAGSGVYQKYGKRLFDLILVVLSLPFVMPVIIIFWAIMSFKGGPGFYRQPRVGAGGRAFDCWKIRTMATDADMELARILSSDPEAAREWQKNQKLKNDPRITRLGKFIRKTSIDELPQIWNVFVGDMSLIGPRPFTLNQQQLYDAHGPDQAYYTLRPGITGLWQVKSRNAGTFDDRIAFDETYALQIGFLNDLKIGFQTVGVVLRATGH